MVKATWKTFLATLTLTTAGLLAVDLVWDGCEAMYCEMRTWWFRSQRGYYNQGYIAGLDEVTDNPETYGLKRMTEAEKRKRNSAALLSDLEAKL